MASQAVRAMGAKFSVEREWDQQPSTAYKDITRFNSTYCTYAVILCTTCVLDVLWGYVGNLWNIDLDVKYAYFILRIMIFEAT